MPKPPPTKTHPSSSTNGAPTSSSAEIERTTSHSSLTAIASSSLQEMVNEMESQLNNVMSSPVFTNDTIGVVRSLTAEEEEEKADAFKEVEGPDFDDNEVGEEEEIVQSFDVPRWLSDETVVEYLSKSIEEKGIEQEYECTIELSGLGSTPNGNNGDSNSNNKHIQIKMTGPTPRHLGRTRRAIENLLISHLITTTPPYRGLDPTSPNFHPPSLGRLLYSLALSSSDNSPRWNDRSRHRTVYARQLLPLYSNKKVWMNIVELPKDEEGRYHGMFLAGRGGRMFEFYRGRFGCRVDIYGEFRRDNDDKHNGSNNEGDNDGNGDDGGDNDNHVDGVADSKQSMQCNPYVLVRSTQGKSNVDDCLQFIEHRIRDHAERFGVSRDREVERVGEMRRMRRQRRQQPDKEDEQKNGEGGTKKGDQKSEGGKQARGTGGRRKKKEVKKKER